MSTLVAFLPRIAVFLVSMVIGAVVANVAVAAVSNKTPQSTAGAAPEYVLAGTDTPLPSQEPVIVAFNQEETGSEEPVPTLSPEDLNAAAAALLGTGDEGQQVEPAAFVDPTDFPRINPITQFDGGPFQGSNCTLASGAMLARLAFGIVTNGSVLRTLQDDQDGGTGLDDLATALARGYGVSAPKGLIRPQQLKDLLANGYGAVIQGIYGEIPPGLRLQRSFTGGHAIYLDGYYPGNDKRGIPEAYFVIDPLGRPGAGYKGEWWPASIVDKFATALGGGRIPAMWAFPPGGVPPDVVGPDVVPIPEGKNEPPDPDNTPNPSATPEPTASAAAPSLGPIEPGDPDLSLPEPPKPPIAGGSQGGIIDLPVFDICLVSPSLPGCPTGVEVLFPAGTVPVLELPPGPTVTVVFVDSNTANAAIVGFTVDPPAPSDVKFWADGVSPAVVSSASAMSSIDLFGTPIILARLDVAASTTYHFQAVAGSGIMAGVSEVGTFTTGSGVKTFDVALSSVASPVFGIGTGISPYAHLGENAFIRPMVKLDLLPSGTACDEQADYGAIRWCLDQADLGPPSNVCTSANVTYELEGIDAESVAVRAFPAEEGTTPEGDLTLDGVLEATGPPAAGTVSVGCLGSGMTYHIAIDAVGDDRGVLASETVTVP